MKFKFSKHITCKNSNCKAIYLSKTKTLKNRKKPEIQNLISKKQINNILFENAQKNLKRDFTNNVVDKKGNEKTTLHFREIQVRVMTGYF